MNSILFLGHDASRTGAPQSLLRLAKWLVNEKKMRAGFILGRPGPLLSDYLEVGPVKIWRSDSCRTLESIRPRRIFERVASRYRSLSIKHFIAQIRPNIVYANTTATSPFAHSLPVDGIPFLLRVPELATYIENNVGSDNFRLLANKATRLIAVSNAVKNYLVETQQVPHELVDVIPGFLPEEAKSSAISEHERKQLRKELGIPTDAFVIGGAGTIDWRKGTDSFVLIAREAMQKSERKNLHFAWMGGGSPAKIPYGIACDTRVLQLEKHISFLGSRSDPLRTMQAFDVFAMTSREDPYPLVVLEAAACAKPTICFQESGGAPEFVEGNCGISVPYMDIPAFARAIMHLSETPALLASMGKKSQLKAIDQHTVGSLGPKVLDTFRKMGVL